MVQERIDLKNLFAEIRRKGSTSQVSRDLDVSMGNISDWKNGRSVPNADRAPGYDITGGQHHERDRGGNYDSILQWQHI